MNFVYNQKKLDIFSRITWRCYFLKACYDTKSALKMIKRKEITGISYRGRSDIFFLSSKIFDVDVYTEKFHDTLVSWSIDSNLERTPNLKKMM